MNSSYELNPIQTNQNKINLVPAMTPYDRNFNNSLIDDDSIKRIYINYLVTDQRNIPLDVSLNETVTELKKKIENKLGIKILNNLMIKHQKRRRPRCLDDETKTLREAHIHNNDEITIGKTDVKGG